MVGVTKENVKDSKEGNLQRGGEIRTGINRDGQGAKGGRTCQHNFQLVYHLLCFVYLVLFIFAVLGFELRVYTC